MRYKHVFGPVLSRRLGISLGVDLVTHKTCSLDCIYCECGKTTCFTMEKKEYVKFEDVTKELEHFWNHNNDPDYITFSGSGEPTLNSKIKQVIDYIKREKQNINVAVLTNSTLFTDPEVRHSLLKADLVVPSLDAALDKAFARINRPIKGIDIHGIIKGIKAFKKEYKGKIWLEIFILHGINDSEADLMALKTAVQQIQPDRVQINTLDRPGTLSGIKPAPRDELERAVKIIGFPKTEIIAKANENIKAGIQRKNIKTAIIETIHRRPCTKQDLLQILKAENDVIDHHIKQLEQEGKIKKISSERGVFFHTLKDS